METVVWHNRQPTYTMKNGPGAGTSALEHGADFALSILTTSGRARDSRLWYIGSVSSHPETTAGIAASPDRSSAYGALPFAVIRQPAWSCFAAFLRSIAAIAGSPANFVAFIARETKIYAKDIQTANLKVK